MSDDLDFIVIDDIPEYVFCIPDDEELENVIPIKGEDGSFKYEKVAELPETGEDGVLYLVPKSHETQTASGNPISINVTEGAGKLSDLKLDSDTSQITYTGKNLLPSINITRTRNGVTFTHNTDGSITLSGTASADTAYPINNNSTGNARNVALSAGSYIVSGGSAIDSNVFMQAYYGVVDGADRYTQNTFTLESDGTMGAYIYVKSGTNTGGKTIYPMVELGSTASSYEPFVGGTASPNPDYPQDINVVTGTQTIDINGTSYPINLGNIWLAEVGAHRDGIKKTDGKWYVEKQVGKVVLDGSETWVGGGTFGNYWRSSIPIADIKPIASNADFVGLSDHFHKDLGVFSTATIQEGMFCQFRNDTRVYFACPISVQSASDWTTWLASHNTTVYYALATPTTTQITDTNLINQLEAARNAALANGTNVISNTATGNNLAGDLELSYYEYDPTNKYNKWLWLDDDAAYEQM